MSSALEDPGGSLVDTLTLALRQCAQQVNVLQSQARRIEDLCAENERLRHELEATRINALKESTADAYRTQFEELFKEDVEKEAEISQLKKIIVTLKVKAQGRFQQHLSSTPLLSSSPLDRSIPPKSTPSEQRHDTNESFARTTLSEVHDTDVIGFTRSPSPPRKRIRGGTPVRRVPLQDIGTNSSSSMRSVPAPNGSRKKIVKAVDRQLMNIPLLAEDGEDYTRICRKPEGGENADEGIPVLHKRLDALLTAPSPSSRLLSRHESTSPKARSRHRIGNDQGAKDHPLLKVRAARGIENKKKDRVLPSPKARNAPSVEDEEPYRSRPINRLSLEHFKLNPNSNSGYDYAFEEVIRNHNDRRCMTNCTKPDCCGNKFKALATTLPPARDGDGELIPNHEILLQFLGPGSEERIATLTPLARENLLLEARTKLVAQTYGRHRTGHEKAPSPPGFWDVDMPSTQEEIEHRERAKIMERELVRQRRDEALKGGRWMFADE